MIVCEILMGLRSLEIHQKLIFNSDGGLTGRFFFENSLGPQTYLRRPHEAPLALGCSLREQILLHLSERALL